MRRYRCFMGSLTLLSLSLSGCAYHPESSYDQATVNQAPDYDETRWGVDGVGGITQDHQDDVVTVEVLRTGRYQLVTTQGSIGQRQLLEQPVHLQVSPLDQLTVGSALQQLLSNTGYRVCQEQSVGMRQVLSGPLPSNHHVIGPMTLRQALAVIMGNDWVLEPDLLRQRLVCFKPRHFIEHVAKDDRVQQDNG